MKKLVLPFLILVLNSVFGQDIRGGEIRYQNITSSSLEYHIEVYLYTQTSLGIDHSTIILSPGGVVNGDSTHLPNDITRWYYTRNYFFPGNGTYDIYALDSFRIANIQNIGNSAAESIALVSTLIINSNYGPNNTPLPYSPQTDIYEVGGNWVFYGVEHDMDNDSLVYSLVPCTSSNYTMPSGITIDAATGTVQMPALPGNYAINIQTDEWRTIGSTPRKIATTFREMIIDSGEVVGIEEIERDINFRIYPNPVFSNSSSQINFTHSPLNNSASLIINNTDGKEVMRYHLQPGSTIEKLTLPKLAAGMYVARLLGVEVESSVKFVVE